MNLKVRKLSIDRHLMASAVTESVHTQHSFLHSCSVEPASQEVVKFLQFLIHFASFHPGHIMAMSCVCLYWVVLAEKNWIWELDSFIEHCSWIRCAMSENCHFHTWGIRNFGLKSSSEVSG